MPTRPDDYRALHSRDFRRTRSYLSDHVFAVVSGGGSPPTDRIEEEIWDTIMALPTDVLLRTTDYQGTMADTYEQCAAWTYAAPHEPAASAYMFDACIDASDEFAASPFIAAHGWYRQARAALRNALEIMAVAAAYAVRNDQAGYRAWRADTEEPRFGVSMDALSHDPGLSACDTALCRAGLFGRGGVARDLYKHLCRYAHSRPGSTNVDIWRSNGPVWVARGFTDFWIDFCDTIGLSYVFLKIGWPNLKLPDVSRPLFGAFSARWHQLGESAEGQFFHEL